LQILFVKGNFKAFKSSSKLVLVAFSGGKDSLATAITLRKQGYEVVLYLLYGVNRGYLHERKHAQKLAELLQLPYVEERLKMKGKTEYAEHPLKNGLIFMHMLDYAQKHQIGRVAFGAQAEETTVQTNLHEDFSDSRECFDALEAWSGVDLHLPLNTETASFEALYEDNPEWFLHLSSCLLPPYRKPNVQKANLRKFGDVLLPGRCGSCYKCCIEYVYLYEQNAPFLHRNASYYERCLNKWAHKNWR